jgi:hypothetical protein
MTNDDLFIFLAARLHRTIKQQDLLEKSAAQIRDWKGIVNVAQANNIIPMISKVINELPNNLVPKHVKKVLNRMEHEIAYHNDKIWNNLSQVLSSLSEYDVLIMKELAFVELVYKKRNLRSIGDVDLLVCEDVKGAIVGDLIALGYQPYYVPTYDYRLKYSSGFHMINSHDIWFDLQWKHYQVTWETKSSNIFPADDHIWLKAFERVVAGSKVYVMSNEDMILHLCLHAEGHEYSELVQLCDLAEFLNLYSRDLDWEQFLQKVVDRGRQSSVFFALLLVESLFDVQIPKDVLKRLKPGYYDAPLQRALFGNLGFLHMTLDVLADRLKNKKFLTRIESYVRLQVSAAICLWKEITLILGDAEIEYSAWFSKGPIRLYPSHELPVFNNLSLIIQSKSVDKLTRILRKSNYLLEEHIYKKKIRFAVIDGPNENKDESVDLAWEIGNKENNSRKLPENLVGRFEEALIGQLKIIVFDLPDEEMNILLNRLSINEDNSINWFGLGNLLLFRSLEKVERFDILSHGNQVEPNQARILEFNEDLRWLPSGRNLHVKNRKISRVFRFLKYFFQIAPINVGIKE